MRTRAEREAAVAACARELQRIYIWQEFAAPGGDKRVIPRFVDRTFQSHSCHWQTRNMLLAELEGRGYLQKLHGESPPYRILRKAYDEVEAEAVGDADLIALFDAEYKPYDESTHRPCVAIHRLRPGQQKAILEDRRGFEWAAFLGAKFTFFEDLEAAAAHIRERMDPLLGVATGGLRRHADALTIDRKIDEAHPRNFHWGLFQQGLITEEEADSFARILINPAGRSLCDPEEGINQPLMDRFKRAQAQIAERLAVLEQSRALMKKIESAIDRAGGWDIVLNAYLAQLGAELSSLSNKEREEREDRAHGPS